MADSNVNFEAAEREATERAAKAGNAEEEEGIEIEDDEDEGEVYHDYVAQKVTEGVAHPTAIVETTSLSAVPPPDTNYEHHLQDVVSMGRISGPQLETVIYANMRFNLPRKNWVRCRATIPHAADQTIADVQITRYRPGFYLADGAGVGKGRQIAALIAEHWRTGGRRILWLSVSNDLKVDAIRDINAMGISEHIKVYPEGKALPPSGGKLAAKGVKDGVVFMTYSLLIAGSTKSDRSGLVREDFLLPAKSRLKQIVQWLRGDDPQDTASPLIILDECHKAKNLISGTGGATATGFAVVLLQEELPAAKVLYSSATGATEPNNLAYMTRIGYFGYDNMQQFLRSINDMGLGAMEMLAMSLKSLGIYTSRTLSYNGAEFQLTSVKLEPHQALMYDRAAQFWQMLYRVFFPFGTEKVTRHHKDETDEDEFEEVTDAQGNVKVKRKVNRAQIDIVRANFWSSHMRFFRQMLIGSKVPFLCAKVNEQLRQGNCCVIGLQSTGEAGAANMGLKQGDDVDDLLSAPRLVLLQLVKNFLPKALNYVSDDHLEVIAVQLKDCLDAWIGRPDCTEAAQRRALRAQQQQEQAGAAPAAAAGAENPQQPPGAPGNTAPAPSAPSANDSDEDLPELVAVKSIDEVLEERRELAKLTGKYIDLTIQLEPGQFEATRLQVEKEEADREAKRRAPASALVLSESDEEAEEDAMDAIRSMSGSLSLRRPPRQPLEEISDQDAALASKTVVPVKRESPASEPAPPEQGAAAKRSRVSPGGPSCSGGSASSSSSDGGRGDDSDFDVEAEIEARRRAKGKAPADETNPAAQTATAAVKAERAESGVIAVSSGSSAATKAPASIYDIVEISSDDDDSDADAKDVKRILPGQKRATRAEVKSTGTVLAKPLGDEWMDEEGVMRRLGTGARPNADLIVRMTMRAVEALELPSNPLDEITALCGGPENVAEMTGRAMHLVKQPDGTCTYVRRVEEVAKNDVNLSEMRNFMEGRKLVAIISDAASTGISLHSDKGRRNTRKRIHYTLELPWSADKAIQQFGRSHRSNQVVPPLYDLMVTDCGGERRFASCAARRLMSLGALTKGDRRAMGAGSDLKEFEIDDKCGGKALTRILEDIMGQTDGPLPGVKPPKLPEDLRHELGFASGAREPLDIYDDELLHENPETCEFYSHMLDCCKAVALVEDDRDSETGETGFRICGSDPRNIKNRGGLSVDRFLNRLLGLCISEQAALFDYFERTLIAEVKSAKSRGEIPMRVVKMDGYTSLECEGRQQLHVDDETGAETTIAKLNGDRRISWESALRTHEENKQAATEGGHHEAVKHACFYEYRVNFDRSSWPYQSISYKNRGERKPLVMLATYRIQNHVQLRKDDMQYCIIKPWGVFKTRMNADLLNDQRIGKWKPIKEDKAKELWDFYYNMTDTHCWHGDQCAKRRENKVCAEGMREHVYVVEGALLPIWKVLLDNRTKIEEAREGFRSNKPKVPLQIVRAELRSSSAVTSGGAAPANAAPASASSSVVGLQLDGKQLAVLKQKLHERGLAQRTAAEEKAKAKASAAAAAAAAPAMPQIPVDYQQFLQQLAAAAAALAGVRGGHQT